MVQQYSIIYTRCNKSVAKEAEKYKGLLSGNYKCLKSSSNELNIFFRADSCISAYKYDAFLKMNIIIRKLLLKVPN